MTEESTKNPIILIVFSDPVQIIEFASRDEARVAAWHLKEKNRTLRTVLTQFLEEPSLFPGQEDQSFFTDYHGTPLAPLECKFLLDLEAQLGYPIPLEKKMKWDIFGYVAINGHIIALQLKNCNLGVLPKSIGDLKSLKYCVLAENKLKTLPPEIGALSSLVSLDLEQNRINTLPESIGQLASLENLQLYKNILSCLPETFGSLHSLK